MKYQRSMFGEMKKDQFNITFEITNVPNISLASLSA